MITNYLPMEAVMLPLAIRACLYHVPFCLLHFLSSCNQRLLILAAWTEAQSPPRARHTQLCYTCWALQPHEMTCRRCTEQLIHGKEPTAISNSELLCMLRCAFGGQGSRASLSRALLKALNAAAKGKGQAGSTGMPLVMAVR